MSVLVSLRPEQWTKNFIVFAALIFARRLLDPAAVALALAAFLIFCALSGAVYLFNDVSDREADRQHPLKSRRPIASGALSVGAALVLGVGADGRRRWRRRSGCSPRSAGRRQRTWRCRWHIPAG